MKLAELRDQLSVLNDKDLARSLRTNSFHTKKIALELIEERHARHPKQAFTALLAVARREGLISEDAGKSSGNFIVSQVTSRLGEAKDLEHALAVTMNLVLKSLGNCNIAIFTPNKVHEMHMDLASYMRHSVIATQAVTDFITSEIIPRTFNTEIPATGYLAPNSPLSCPVTLGASNFVAMNCIFSGKTVATIVVFKPGTFAKSDIDTLKSFQKPFASKINKLNKAKTGNYNRQ